MFVSTAFLARTGLKALDAERFWQVTSIPLSTLTAKLQQADSSVGDLDVFQRNPVLTLQSKEGAIGHLCIDDGFLLDKAGRSLPWVLVEHVESGRRGDVLASLEISPGVGNGLSPVA
jgi:hypothetical protein